MRRITEIIIHCTATPEGRDHSVEDITRWHRARGFSTIGYHYLIGLDGTVFAGRPLEQEGAHTVGHNKESVGICYVGGLTADGKKPKDTRTPEQKASLRLLVDKLRRQFPGAKVYGHRDFASKECPCFDVATAL